MANPGWYPDASGRFWQRFHDGVRWTEHIVDDRGNRGTDPVGAGPPTALDATAAATPAWRPHVPVALASVGGLFVVLSAFTLAFLVDGGGVSLHQLGQLDRSFTGWALGGYAELGRFVTLPVVGLAVAVASRWAGAEPRWNAVAAGLAGALGTWHLVAMFATGELDVGPAFGALVGLAGYVALVAAQVVRLRDVTAETANAGPPATPGVTSW